MTNHKSASRRRCGGHARRGIFWLTYIKEVIADMSENFTLYYSPLYALRLFKNCLPFWSTWVHRWFSVGFVLLDLYFYMYVLHIAIFSVGHCVVCPSSIYGFWLPLRCLQTLFFIIIRSKLVFAKIWIRYNNAHPEFRT